MIKTKMKELKEPEVIGFFIEGDNIVVANPCTIPVDMMKDALNNKTKKNEVTCMFGITIPFPKGLKIKASKTKNKGDNKK